jgi:putative acetyltransferase
MLDALLEDARRRGIRQVSLETGSAEFFHPARSLYTRAGFRPCPPFADYLADPHSAFMTIDLSTD